MQKLNIPPSFDGDDVALMKSASRIFLELPESEKVKLLLLMKKIPSENGKKAQNTVDTLDISDDQKSFLFVILGLFHLGWDFTTPLDLEE